MILLAEAARLALVEALCPTAALDAGTGFPTLAGRLVYDSTPARVQDLDEGQTPVPVISIYSRSASAADSSGSVHSSGPSWPSR